MVVILKLLAINSGLTALFTTVGWGLFLFFSGSGISLPNMFSKVGFILIAPMFFFTSDVLPKFLNTQRHPLICLVAGLICQFLVYLPLAALFIGIWHALRVRGFKGIR